MPAPTVQQIWQDKEFHALAPGEQSKVMARIDPEFAALPTMEQGKVVATLSSKYIGGSPRETQGGVSPGARNQINTPSILGKVASEPLRIAQELVTVPLSSAKKAIYGLGALAATGNSLLRGRGIDQALQSGTDVMAGFTPVQGPMDSSMLAQGVGKLADIGITKAENATGNTGWAEAGITAGMDIAGLLGGGKLLSKTGKAIASNPKALIGAAGIRKVPPIAMPVEVAAPRILQDYSKAIRPGVKGTGKSAKQFNEANAGYVQGVYDIVDAKNKGVINVGREELGQTIENRLPKTLQEHLDATAQARVNAFNEYNAMKVQAGENGVVIDLAPIAATLKAAAGDSALRIARPSVAKYMNDMAGRLLKQREFTPDEAQAALTKFNSVLDYTKVAPEVAENAMVDKSVAAQLREGMNRAIMSDGNPGYQAARNKYGRLAQMETEAATRARVAGRQAPSSLFDGVVGALTSGEIVGGLLTANPMMLTRGAGSLSFKYWRNKMNSPDHQISRMYRTAEKSFVEPNI